MSRLRLALNVADIDAAVEFYAVLADAGAELEGRTIAEADPATDLGPAAGGGCCGTDGSAERVDDQVDRSATARGQ